MRLGKQGLEGPFPEMLMNLTGLVWFDMAANNITGSIPESIAQLTELGFLALGTNKVRPFHQPMATRELTSFAAHFCVVLIVTLY